MGNELDLALREARAAEKEASALVAELERGSAGPLPYRGDLVAARARLGAVQREVRQLQTLVAEARAQPHPIDRYRAAVSIALMLLLSQIAILLALALRARQGW